MSQSPLLRLVAPLLLSLTAAAQLRVLGTEPGTNAIVADPAAPLRLHFDRPLDPTTVPPLVPTAMVMSSIDGPTAGTFVLENGNTTLRFDPARAFRAGEDVVYHLFKDARGADGTRIRRTGYTLKYRTAVRPAPFTFRLVDDQDLHGTTPGAVTVYGGVLADLDRDGFPDIPVTCENSADLRVLMSRGDATGRYETFLPPNPLGSYPSPIAAVELNGDSSLDLIVANTGGSTISVLFGNGNGTFQPRVDWPAGVGPRGLVVFDTDGDGHLDVVTANSISDNLTCLINDGSGGFLAPIAFDAGGAGEFAIAAEDMDGNGALDLIVGMGSLQRIQILLDDGPARWQPHSSTYCGGTPWSIQVGDSNGDGFMDVAVANALSNNGAVLFGDGTGGLSAPLIIAAGQLPVATDLGDFDGDGDLDLTFSAFIGGFWRVFRNDGAQGFTWLVDFPAQSNAACTIPADIDGDRDLDLVLFDEGADRVRFMINGAGETTPVCSGDGLDAACPCDNHGAVGHGCARSGNPQGAQLTATGSTAPDSLVLTATGMSNGTTALFLAGDTFQPAAAFGDGLLCAGGSLLRFGRQAAAGGIATFPITATQDVSISSDTTSGSGDLRVYQVYYRNAASFCTPETFNSTNGLVVVW